ncbi:IclR family transcriptional regulator domain-containing protein [Demequina maris]|uniref:IclR family transcriptional regulator domain-containing protein n=1 Tax=Demequina maris TaxID=1638982 RepID=UPI001E53B1E5|nr:IclR family transcriptional regulator C-terminal domain-containing protein [Demequina maris]
MVERGAERAGARRVMTGPGGGKDGVEQDAALSPDALADAIATGLSVIRAFDASRPALTLDEVGERSGLAVGAARDALDALGRLGYVRDEARAYALTPRVLELGMGYLSSLGLPAVAQPHLERLSQELGESASAAVLDGGEIVYVARAAARRITSVRIAVGTRLPVHATAMGRVLLARLPEESRERVLRTARLAASTPRTVTDPDALREILRGTLLRGWTEVDGELEDGLRSIAVPVRGAYGVDAAIGVATVSGRSGLDTATAVERLSTAARAIEDDLRAVALGRDAG